MKKIEKEVMDFWWESRLIEKLKEFLVDDSIGFDSIILYVNKVIETEKNIKKQ